MKEWRGLWLPDGEKHLIEWMQKVNKIVDGKPTYQFHKLEAALRNVTKWRVAVDVGAHCGLWSMHLVKRFERVFAFEPVAAHRQCFEMNVPQGAVLAPCALGDRDDLISIHSEPTSSGNSWVNGKGEIPMRRLDFYELQNVDFIKIDVEGGEELVIKGGLETIKRCRPVMIVEQKGHAASTFGLDKTGAIRLLESIGMKSLCPPISGDWIMGF